MLKVTQLVSGLAGTQGLFISKPGLRTFIHFAKSVSYLLLCPNPLASWGKQIVIQKVWAGV